MDEENTLDYGEYESYEENQLKNINGFAFFPSKTEQVINKNDLCKRTVKLECGIPKYDEIYNQYKVNIKQTFKFVMPKEGENSILNYIITVPFDWKTNEKPYLRGLTTQGSIDLNLIDSGYSNLLGYRFWNDPDAEYTEIALFFELYPKAGKSFTNLRLKFIDYTDTSKDITLEKRKSYTYSPGGDIRNGSTTIRLYWKDCKVDENNISYDELIFKKQQVYKVIITYTDCDGNDINLKDYWLLTTRLFNSCYDSTNPETYVSNYCYPASETETKIIESKKKIKVKITCPNDKNIISSSTERSSTGSLLSTNKHIEYASIQTDTLTLNPDAFNLEIENPEYYPEITLETKNISITIDKNDIESICKSVWEEYSLTNSNFNIENSGNKINIITKETISGEGRPATNLKNVFVKMSEALPHMIQSIRQLSGIYCGVFPDTDFASPDVRVAFIESSNNEHGARQFSDPYYSLSENSSGNQGPGSTLIQEGTKAYCLGQYPITTFPFTKSFGDYHFNLGKDNISYDSSSEYDEQSKEMYIGLSILNNEFNQAINDSNHPNQPCTWLFSNNEEYDCFSYHGTGHDISREEITNKESAMNHTIIWWRSIDSNDNVYWRASKTLIEKSRIESLDKLKSNGETLTKQLFGKDFYFCFIKNTGNGDSGFYIADGRNGSEIKLIKDDNINLEGIQIKISGSFEGGYNGIIKFSCDSNTINEDKQIDYKINLGENRLSYQLNYLTLSTYEFEKIDTNGRTKDSEGDLLDINSIYIENQKTHQLDKVAVSPYILSKDNVVTFENEKGFQCRYLYCKEKQDSRKNIIYSNNSTCCIDYIQDNGKGNIRIYFRNVPIIPQINEKQSN